MCLGLVSLVSHIVLTLEVEMKLPLIYLLFYFILHICDIRSEREKRGLEKVGQSAEAFFYKKYYGEIASINVTTLQGVTLQCLCIFHGVN